MTALSVHSDLSTFPSKLQGLNKDSTQVQTNVNSEDEKYLRFTEKRKKYIVILASAACFMTPMAGLAFLPAVSTIAESFTTSSSMINISNAVYNVFMAFSSFWSPFSDIYGRRMTFLLCLTFSVISMMLVGLSQNLAMFFIFRATTSFFGSAFFALGAQIISDIYPPTERGSAMGWNIAGSQIGPPLGPTFGAIVVTYGSWRIIFYSLAGFGAVVSVLAFFFLPETMANTKHEIALAEYNSQQHIIESPQKAKKFMFLYFNPFASVYSLKYPTLLLAGIASSALMYNMYTMLTPIRFVVDPRFSLTVPLYGGLFYLPPGCGYLLGSLIGGRLSDYQVKKSMEKRGGVRVAEDRLRITLLGYGIGSPISILVYGWSIYYEKGGYAVPIISMFLNGFFQTSVFPTINSYCVDSMSSHIGGAAVGGNYFIRFLASAIASATCLYSINDIGVGWTSTIAALFLVIGALCLVALVIWGQHIRRCQLNDLDII